jgi:hypothetical protein
MIHYLRRTLLNPGIYAAILLALVLVVVAYQVRPAYDITIGTTTDGPLLQSFYDRETPPKDSSLPYSTYRWTRGDASSITFQDVGAQDFDVVLAVNGARPAGQASPALTVTVGSLTSVSAAPPPGVQEYRFSVPREQVKDGTLRVDLQTNSFKPQGDARQLGIIITHITVSPSANPDRFVVPPTGPLLAILSAVALLSSLLALFGWGPGGVFLGGGSLALLAGSLLIFDRLWLTSGSWYWSWCQALIAAGVLALICRPVAGWLFARGGVRWSALQRRCLLTLVLVVFAVRLAGQLHPSIFVYDLGFHVNILQRVSSGDLFFTTQPAEFGGFGYSTFYLPTPYLFIEPLRWLVGDPRMAIRLMTVATGTLGALPVFYLATRVSGRGRAGLIAATLYLIMPMSVIIFSWGITPNIFGEFFALCSLAVLVGGFQSLRPNKPVFWVLAALLMITILSHPGVLALATAAFLAIPAIWWIYRRRLGDWKIALGALGAYAVAAVAAIAIYYWHFIPGMIQTLQKVREDRAAGTGAGGVPLVVGGSVEDNSIGLFQREVHNFGQWLFWGLEGFWREAQAYYTVWPIVGAVAGYSYLSARARTFAEGGTGRALVLAVAGWTVSVVLFALAGWATNLFVRYPLFALPVITIGAGLLLSATWGRGRAGRWLTALVLVFFAVQALAFWQYRINYIFK